MPDPSPSNADSLTVRKKEWWPATADSLAGIEPTTFRLLVRRATSRATETSKQ